MTQTAIQFPENLTHKLTKSNRGLLGGEFINMLKFRNNVICITECRTFEYQNKTDRNYDKSNTKHRNNEPTTTNLRSRSYGAVPRRCRWSDFAK